MCPYPTYLMPLQWTFINVAISIGIVRVEAQIQNEEFMADPIKGLWIMTHTQEQD